MVALEIVEILLSRLDAGSAKALIEASVHRPKRGRRWIATFRDGSGKQFWRSTGQTDRRAAMVVAQKLERGARQARAEQGVVEKPVLRASPETGLTQKEVALLIGLSQRAVRDIEKRALRKLKQHPALRALWRELVRESSTSPLDLKLNDAEIAAVYGLARKPYELRVLDKLMALVSALELLPGQE